MAVLLLMAKGKHTVIDWCPSFDPTRPGGVTIERRFIVLSLRGTLSALRHAGAIDDPVLDVIPPCGVKSLTAGGVGMRVERHKSFWRVELYLHPLSHVATCKLLKSFGVHPIEDNELESQAEECFLPERCWLDR